MATFQKRGKNWRVQVFRHGKRIGKTFPTKSAAMGWAASIEQSHEAEDRGELPEKTFAEMMERYRLEITPAKDGAKWENLRIRRIVNDAPFKHKFCHRVTSDDVGQWRDKRLKEVKPASVRRELTILSAVFSKAAKEWKWIRESPMPDVEKPGKEPPRRRGIRQDEINKILRALQWHGEVIKKRDLVAVAFLLAIETGMRAGELLSLDPGRVDLKARVASLAKTKNGDPRDVPLSGCAVQLLALVSCRLQISSATLDTMFRRYRDKANVQNLHFHDTRSEAISRLSRKMDVLELAQMVGHRDLKSLLIYYKRSASEIARKL